MTSWGRFSTLIATAAAAVVFTPAAASAGQIDNDGQEDVYVNYNCGVSCGGYLSIKSGGSVATTSDGNAHAGFPVNAEDRNSPWKCESGNYVYLQATGDVGITYDPGKKDPDTDNVVPGTETFTWASKSGYDPAFRTVHPAVALGGDGSYCWGSHW